MKLRDFLAQEHHGRPQHNPVPEWQAAMTALVQRFRTVLAQFDQLTLTDWAVLREHRGVRYNADALSIEFGDVPIRLEPIAVEPEAGVLGRASLDCGVQQVHLDCSSDAAVWSYRWVIPHEEQAHELTDAAIESLVLALLQHAGR